MAADQDLTRLFQIRRLLEQETRFNLHPLLQRSQDVAVKPPVNEPLSLGDRISALYKLLFENERSLEREIKLGPCVDYTPDDLDRALHDAREIVVRYTELFYEPSHLPVTFYRRQRRISARTNRGAGRTGSVFERTHFLYEKGGAHPGLSQEQTRSYRPGFYERAVQADAHAPDCGSLSL
jgi:hypothetical protein